MIQELLEKEKIVGDIPLAERMAFQRFLLKKIMGEHPVHDKDGVWSQEKNDQAYEYGKKISTIIDDEKNEEIRSLIMKGDIEDNYEKAGKMVLEILGINL